MNRYAVIAGLLLLAACSSPPDPLREVNVFNGTAAAGNTYPGATVPFGAVQLSPDTDPGLASGYHYDHQTILGDPGPEPGRSHGLFP